MQTASLHLFLCAYVAVAALGCQKPPPGELPPPGDANLPKTTTGSTTDGNTGGISIPPTTPGLPAGSAQSVFVERCQGTAVVRWSSVENAKSYTILRDGAVVGTQIPNDKDAKNAYADPTVDDAKTYRFQIEVEDSQGAKKRLSPEFISEGRMGGRISCASTIGPWNIYDVEPWNIYNEGKTAKSRTEGIGATGACSVVAADAKSPSMLYLGHEDGGLLMSVDNGKNWFNGSTGLQSDKVVDVLTAKDIGTATHIATVHGLFYSNGVAWKALEPFKKAAEQSGNSNSMRLVPGLTQLQLNGTTWMLVPSEAGLWSFSNNAWTLNRLPGCGAEASAGCVMKKLVTVNLGAGQSPVFYALTDTVAYMARIQEGKLAFVDNGPLHINKHLVHVRDIAPDMHNAGRFLIISKDIGPKNSHFKLNLSQDGGKTYTHIKLPHIPSYGPPGSEFNWQTLYNVAIDSSDQAGKIFWAYAEAPHGPDLTGTWRSVDSGKTWKPIPLAVSPDIALGSVRFLPQAPGGFGLCSNYGMYRYDAKKNALVNPYPYISTNTVSAFSGRAPEIVANVGNYHRLSKNNYHQASSELMASWDSGASWPSWFSRETADGPHGPRVSVYNHINYYPPNASLDSDWAVGQLLTIPNENGVSSLVVAGNANYIGGKGGGSSEPYQVIIFTKNAPLSKAPGLHRTTLHFPEGMSNKNLKLIPGSLQYTEGDGIRAIWLGAYDVHTKRPTFFRSTDMGKNWSVYPLMETPAEFPGSIPAYTGADIPPHMQVVAGKPDHIVFSRGNILYEGKLGKSNRPSSEALQFFFNVVSYSRPSAEATPAAARLFVQNSAEKILSFEAFDYQVPKNITGKWWAGQDYSDEELMAINSMTNVVVFTEESAANRQQYRLRYWNGMAFEETSLPDNVLQGMRSPVVYFAGRMPYVTMVIKFTPASGFGTQTKMYQSQDRGKTWRDITSPNLELVTPTHFTWPEDTRSYISTLGSGIVEVMMPAPPSP